MTSSERDLVAVATRGLTKIVKRFKSLGTEIKSIRSKGATALITPSDQNLFIGMYLSLEQIFEECMSLHEQASEYCEEKGITPVFPSTEDTTLVAEKSHAILDCEVFKSAEPSQRLGLLRSWSGCRNCLHPFHRTRQCTSKYVCRECKGRHNTLLHLPISDKTSQGNTSSSRSNHQPSTTSANGFVGASMSQRHSVMLGTVVVCIKDPDGQSHKFRGVLDAGSMHSFVTEECARLLGHTLKPFQRNISGVNDSPLKNVLGKIDIIFESPKLCLSLETEAVVVPQTFLDSDMWSDYQSYPLSDPEFTNPGPISFLIGADLYPDVITGAPVVLHEHGPRLISTLFGYTVIGKFILDTSDVAGMSLFSMSDIAPLIERFWKIEESTITHSTLSPDEEQCEQHFMETHRRNEGGRYIVSLPFKNPAPKLHVNSNKVISRLHSLETKLSKNEKLSEEYHTFMNDYAVLGHMSVATAPPRYLIPHHPGYKTVSEGRSKLRVVFDASFRTATGSLNDHLLAGPKLQADIADIVLHFRRFPYVLTCDIVKMFRQILVEPEDRPYQQIIWHDKPSDPLQYFSLDTVTYGLRCSPFLAQRVLHQLAKDEGDQFPDAAQALLHHTYVDDVAYGCDTPEKLIDLKNQLINLLSKGDFELDKWSTNYPPLLSNQSLSQQPVPIQVEDSITTKILGMEWNPSSDTFSYQVVSPPDGCTKREILSAIARLFDPLGYLAPVIFFAKRVLQETWKSKLDWDDQVPESLSLTWNQFTTELPALSSIAIPRLLPKSDTTYQLLCFSDASEKGYCGAAYLRATQGDTVTMTLLKAKTRLAPLKTLTVPRLELCGALLLSQLIRSLEHLRTTLDISQLYCFTDSTIVLSWLRTPTYLLQTFVANRVRQILDITSLDSWYHIKGIENPADIGSRGVPPSALEHLSLWWCGPHWSHKPIKEWPISTETPDVEVPELKPNTLSLVSVQRNTEFLQHIERHSSLVRLTRVLAYVKRFIRNSRIPAKFKIYRAKGPLTSVEFTAANHHITIVQHHHYPEAFTNVHFNSLPLELRRLNIFVDRDGILRIGGRLLNAPLPVSQKYPILLPSRSHYTNLLVDHYHHKNHHIGPSALLATIRQLYWIPAARSLVKLIRRRCVVCIRFSRYTLAPLMGNLPASRFNAVRPFMHTGVDFAGPFLCRTSQLRKSSIEKSYLSVYICLSTRAVHLELAIGLSVENFLDTFEGFISRRGIPAVMHSDCGTNFVGAAAYLQHIYSWFEQENTKASIMNRTSHLAIEWKFNPPLSPHFGGSWEAAVKSTKTLLQKAFGKKSYTSWELSTMFTKIECILNSRPLQPISDSPEDTEALTPGHFLVGHPLNAIPEPCYDDVPANRLLRWELIRERVQYFWSRWKDEYIRSLQVRDKWTKAAPSLKVDDLVLISDARAPPTQWKMARILCLHPGQDNVVRVVTLKTSLGVYKRPSIKLVPLLV